MDEVALSNVLVIGWDWYYDYVDAGNDDDIPEWLMLQGRMSEYDVKVWLQFGIEDWRVELFKKDF